MVLGESGAAFAERLFEFSDTGKVRCNVIFLRGAKGFERLEVLLQL